MSNRGIACALVALGLPALSGTTFSSAPESIWTEISGVFTMKVVQQHALPVGDLLLTQSAGTNRNTGKAEYMEGSQVLSREIADLTQGSGPQQGYITEVHGADTTVTRYQGKVVTTLGPDGKPVTSFEGTWTKLRGTGKYQGVSGGGKYKGRMLSPTEYTAEWSGEIQTQRTAAR